MTKRKNTPTEKPAASTARDDSILELGEREREQLKLVYPRLRKLAESREPKQRVIDEESMAEARATDEKMGNVITAGIVAGIEPLLKSLEAPRLPKDRDWRFMRRRKLVEQNSELTAREICDLFDRQQVPLPKRYYAAGFRRWSLAYKNPKYRGNIDKLIADDRRKNQKTQPK
jgi:hypothetical protein